MKLEAKKVKIEQDNLKYKGLGQDMRVIVHEFGDLQTKNRKLGQEIGVFKSLRGE